MTLAGGPANKLGNRYETLWTVSECVRILDGKADSIRIEEPGTDKAEFVVRTGRRREFHQVKRSHTEGKWTVRALGSDLIRAIGSALQGGEDRFVFVSGSDAFELRTLCEAATGAASLEEFQHWFLDADLRKRPFNALLKEWACAPATAFDRLRRIAVHTTDDHQLEKSVLWSLQALFLGQPRNLLDALRALVEDSVLRTLDREHLIKHLNERGYQLRRLRRPKNAALALRDATKRYLDAARKPLIQHSLVPRHATKEVLALLSDAGTDSVVTGKAGAGKTACVVEITETLLDRGWPVLTFPLDLFADARTTGALGCDLDLEESPALVLAAAGEIAERPSVLIIDQLDAVSSISGRNLGALDIVEALLREVRGKRGRAVIHTIVVCRTFEWQHDDRLRGLLPRDSNKVVPVEDFTDDQAKTILSGAGFDVALLRKQQLDLLRHPQNLSLFLGAQTHTVRVDDFGTEKELLDRYWKEKKHAVAIQSAPAPEQWTAVLGTLCDEMAATQQLSLPCEILDQFSTLYIDQLASEGVITIDGGRCRFGHESFFDYCFARFFFKTGEHLVGFLKQSEQHLFRRAQVRQVLTYLRDADHGRYISELQALLADEGIRTHIKALAIALLAEVAKPTQEEWQVRVQLVGPALDARERGQANVDKLSDIAWMRFFGSKSWFDITCQHGVVNDWLTSDNDTLADDGVRYLSWHAEHSPEQAVALLEPYASHGGDWPRRLRSVARGHYANRRLFDFCLQLIDAGAFDEGGESFMDTFFGLDDRHAERFAQALARWLRRRLATSRGTDNVLTESVLFGDYADASTIIKAAEAAPAAFVHHILPVVLDISDACAVGDTPPKDDTVWRATVGYPSGAEACLSALADALATTARESTDDVREVIGTLRERDTHVANGLLLALYRGGATKFADEAAGLLCKQPWRIELETETIRVVVPQCSAESRKRLEDMILGYVSPYEHTKHGFRHIGSSRFDLLSAFPPELRSPSANAHFKELEQKFGEPNNERAAVRGGTVASPIGEDAANRMTDEQWLRAFGKYDSEDDSPSIDPFKGGARELAHAFERRVKEEPERFAQLCLKIPADANALYLDHALSALKESDVSINLKLEVCRQGLDSALERCGSSIAMVVGRIKDPLPDEAVRMLHRLFVESKDGGILYAGDLYAHSRTARGSVADAVRDLILTDAAYVDRFRPTLERMVCDQSPAVLFCVAGALDAVGYFDAEFGVSLLKRMNLSEDRLLATRHMESFLRNRLRDSFVEVRPFIERMLRSAIANVRQAGARLAGLAVLATNEAEHLFDEAAHGSSHHRFGLAEVAATYVASPDYRGWCEGLLPTLFNDDDSKVRRQAASCFWQLENTALETYGGLIRAFSESRASQEFAFAFFHALEQSLERLPGLTCEICAKLASRPDAEGRQLDMHILIKLAFRVYQQHQNDEWTSKALDLIDLLCLNGAPTSSKSLRISSASPMLTPTR